jgi:Fic family protein
MSLALEEAVAPNEYGVEEIQSIHLKLMASRPHKRLAGRIRSEQNWIGGNDYNPCGAEFVPPPPEDVPRLLADLSQAIGDDSFSPLVQAALVHAQFETIHPFADGNGRTGRALVHVILRRRGLAPRFTPPVSVVFAGARDRYISGLTSFRGPDVVAWIEQFASAMWQATALASSYLATIRQLRDGWREQLAASPGAPRADAAAWAIIDVLPAHPIISAPVAAIATGRAKAAIYEGIAQLTDAGILEPLSQNRRNRSWEASGLLPIIAQLEEGTLPAHTERLS